MNDELPTDKTMSRRVLLAAGTAGAVLASKASAQGAEGTQNEAKDGAKHTKLTPFLTFQGKADDAIKLYVGLFKNSKIVSLEHYGAEGPGPVGTVRMAEIVLCGQSLRCLDSPVPHRWTFSPAISMFIESNDEAEITGYFEKLADQGVVMMPLDKYPFSKKFGWVQDRFGVSWQLSVI